MAPETGKWFIYFALMSILTAMTFGQGINLPNFDLLETFKVIPTLDPDTYRRLPELITSKGYPVEEHDVTTKDGYILGVYRIPHGIKDQNDKVARQPILLHHGLACAGSDWVINSPNQSLGFLLADAGYDVWLANTRGNTYSKRHIKYTPNDDKFWNFSWDEMALIDLPTVIDYILAKTDHDQLLYAGHSMGTTVAFAMLSEYPEYNKKVKAFMALAPAVYLSHMTTPLRNLVPFQDQIASSFKLLGQNEILAESALRNSFTDLVCSRPPISVLCRDIFFYIDGGASNQINKSRLSVIFHHYPAGASVNTALHFAQTVKSKKFTKFDYGKIKNIKEYRQLKPPKYNIEAITTPVALFWGEGDNLVVPTDVALLVPRIKNLIENYKVPLPEFAHEDFVYGMDANKLVYERLMAILEDYRN